MDAVKLAYLGVGEVAVDAVEAVRNGDGSLFIATFNAKLVGQWCGCVNVVRAVARSFQEIGRAHV